MQITLQNRITTIMVVFVVALTSAFTLVQLQNQLKTITIFNSLKARLTLQITRDSLEKKLSELAPEQDARQVLESTLDSLQRSGLIETAFVYSEDGTIKASTERLAIGKKASGDDLSRISEAIRGKAADKEISSFVEKTKRALQLYAPVSANNVTYVARLDFSLGNMADAARGVFIPVVFIVGILIAANLIFGLVLSKNIIGPISLLNTASKEMAGGDLNLRIHMNTGDELQELADTFNVMAVELKKMKQKAENANPLTKLPGNIVIREEVEKRISENKKFTVIYCDLDNFKAFNDKYGIQAGDEAIKLTAKVFKEAVAVKGNPDDFLGHEGGDDFILLTTPDKAQEIGQFITSEFDKRIRSLYNKEDLERGYIEAKSRYGEQVMKFPIMSVSLAGVTNEIRPISSYGEITNIAAEVKKKAKATQGSCLVIDKRKE